MMKKTLVLGLGALSLCLTGIAAGWIWKINQLPQRPEVPKQRQVVDLSQAQTEEKIALADGRIQAFAKELKSTLVAGMKAGGPLNAIHVCNTEAPELADTHSGDGFYLGRTSLKIRNPGNAPTAAERETLAHYAELQADGEDMSQVKTWRIEQDGEHSVFRYMKPIVMAKPCLACHGSNIKPEVQAKLDELYPEDQATGYSLGDLRGAFTVTMELD
jgi:hypothetical protein